MVAYCMKWARYLSYNTLSWAPIPIEIAVTIDCLMGKTIVLADCFRGTVELEEQKIMSSEP